MQNAPAEIAIPDFLTRLSPSSASTLLLDYDGTLAPFQTDRHHAYPYPGILTILDRILQRGKTRVVIISGRPVNEIQALIHPLSSPEIWGAHGQEHLLADGTYRLAIVSSEIVESLKQAEARLNATGLSSAIEIKPGGIATHWRGLSSTEMERIQLLAQKELEPFAQRPGFKLLCFDGGLELRAAHPDKGDAVSAILKESAPDAPIAFLGDDITDEDAFRTLNGHGLSILVRDQYRKTEAQAWLRPPHELLGFLEAWLNRIT
jgi:trehalose 6-phosphate phosphatase